MGRCLLLRNRTHGIHSFIWAATGDIVLPVKAAADGATILPGPVYVAPRKRHLLAEPECLRVTRGPREKLRSVALRSGAQRTTATSA
jgi:hypothetical protein